MTDGPDEARRGGWTSRVSVAWLVPLLLTIPTLVGVGVVSALMLSHARDSAQELALQRLGELQRRIDAQLDGLLASAERITSVNESLVLTGKIDGVDDWRETMVAQTSTWPGLSGVMWGEQSRGDVAWVFRYPGSAYHEWGLRDDGEEVVERRITDDGEVGEELGRYPYDPRERPWYRAAVEAGTPTWTPPYAWVQGDGGEVTLGLPFVRPVTRDGELLGVLDAEVSLDDIGRFLKILDVGEGGIAFIVDGDGRLIATSGEATVVGDDLEAVRADASDDPRIARYAGGDRVDVDGTPYLARSADYAGRRGIAWQVVTLVPEAQFLGTVERARRRTMLLGAAVVVATLALGTLLARLIARPIVRLENQVRAIGAGKLDEQVDVRTTRELASLSDEINKMTVGLRDREQVRHALEVAMQVQQALLPQGAPTVPGLDIAGRSNYCDETGGDYFDFLALEGIDHRHAAVVVGDVMGHGVAAALLMATARGVLRSRAKVPGSLGELLGHLNDLLVVDTGGRRFMTLLLMVVDVEAGQLRWASAGHDAPFIYDPDSPEGEPDLPLGGLPLGVLAGASYEEMAWGPLRAGQILLSATDGVWEAKNAADEEFGRDRVRALIREHAARPAREIKRAILDAVEAFAVEQDDDITLVVVKVLPDAVVEASA